MNNGDLVDLWEHQIVHSHVLACVTGVLGSSRLFWRVDPTAATSRKPNLAFI